MASKPPRRVIWIPIVHSQSDLGSLGHCIRELYVRRMGQSQWDRHIRMVDDAWTEIRKAIDSMDLAFDTVKIYQDGLPNSGHELQIVKDLAEAGSQNHQIVLDLVEKGAALVGTESPELLTQEYNLVQQTLARLASDTGNGLTKKQRELSALVLDKRDRYIAARVNETLRSGETGLVFLGMLHAVHRHLPPDIQVTDKLYWS
jgi:hypothetical protein